MRKAPALIYFFLPASARGGAGIAQFGPQAEGREQHPRGIAGRRGWDVQVYTFTRTPDPAPTWVPHRAGCAPQPCEPRGRGHSVSPAPTHPLPASTGRCPAGLLPAVRLPQPRKHRGHGPGRGNHGARN